MQSTPPPYQYVRTIDKLERCKSQTPLDCTHGMPNGKTTRHWNRNGFVIINGGCKSVDNEQITLKKM
jgi:hypothetical protein